MKKKTEFFFKLEKIIFVSLKSLDLDLEPDLYIAKRAGSEYVH